MTDSTSDRPDDQRAAAFVIPPEITVPLKVTVKKAGANGEEYSELHFTAPTIGQLKQVEARSKSQGDAAANILLLSLCNARTEKLSPVEVEAMNAIDFQICIEALSPFLLLKRRSAESND
jgi:hypothetical protein